MQKQVLWDTYIIKCSRRDGRNLLLFHQSLQYFAVHTDVVVNVNSDQHYGGCFHIKYNNYGY